MHEYRKYFTCCDPCYSAACLRDADDTLVHAYYWYYSSWGHFGIWKYCAIWRHLFLSTKSNTESTCSTTTKFGARLVYKLPLKDNALFAQQQNCWSVDLSRQITDNDWMQALDMVKWVSRTHTSVLCKGPTPCWITAVNTHKLFERSQI